MINLFKRRLGVKIIVPIALIIIVINLGLFLGTRYWQSKNTMQIIHDSAVKISDIMLSAIEEPMSMGDDEGTADQLDKAAEEFQDITIYLTNFKGNITYSTEHGAIRKDLGPLYDNQDFNELLNTSLETEIAEGKQLNMAGSPNFVEVITIANRPECYHCHGSRQPILGSMVMLQDISSQTAALMDTQINTAIISTAGAIILVLTLMLFIRKTVLSKIHCISVISDRIRQGDYNAEFMVSGQDELGTLCNNLRLMVGTIRDNLEYNKSVLGGIVLPFFVTDHEERINYINEQLLSILGMVQDEALGTAVSRVLRNTDETDIAAGVIRTGVSRNGRLTYTRGDGVQFPLLYEISPLKNADGKVVGAIGIMVDQTQEERDKARIVAQQENLLLVATKVTDVAGLLSTSADELNTRMVDLSSSMDSTAERTSQVATAMEQMNVSVIEVAKNASSVAKSSGEANEVAQRGGDEMRATVDDTRDLARRAAQLAGSLNDLSDKAENIGRIINVINDIADQTNLLALNAAIEAARAGEAGRGFAVVADEVRKLAEKTMEATKEVEGAIASIQDSTRSAVQEMDDTKSRIESTADKAEESGRVLEEIVGQSRQIADMVQSIATAAEEQSATSEQINASVSGINDLSKNVSQGIAEASSSIRQVSEMASELTKMVEEFKSDRREHERVKRPGGQQARLCHVHAGGSTLAAELVDMGRGGCRFTLHDDESATLIHTGSRIALDTHLGQDDEDLNGISGEIIWAEGGEYGVKFDAEVRTTAEDLKRYLHD